VWLAVEWDSQTGQRSTRAKSMEEEKPGLNANALSKAPSRSLAVGVSIQLDDVAMKVSDTGVGGGRGGKVNNLLAPPPPPATSLLSVPAPGGAFPLPNSQQVASSSSSGSATGEIEIGGHSLSNLAPF